MKSSIKLSVSNIFIWIVVGLISAGSIAAMWLSNSTDIHKFYNTGKVFDIPEAGYKSFVADSERGYADNHGNWYIVDDIFKHTINVVPDKKLKYLIVDISATTEIPIIWEISTFNEGWTNETTPQMYELRLGQNVLDLTKLKYEFIRIQIDNQAGAVFGIDSMQLREYKPITNFCLRYIKRFVVLGAIYYLITAILLCFAKRIKWRLSFDKPIAMLQWLYIKIGDIGLGIVGLMPVRTRGILASILWLMVILYCNATYAKMIIAPTTVQKTITLSAIILGIAILSLRKKLKTVGWNNLLVKVWLVLAAMITISDILVKKVFMYQGLIMVFVFGFLIFVWNNMERPEIMMENLIWAIHIYFVIATVFCLLCRPDVFQRYTGTFTNPVEFGTYATIIASVALVCMDNLISKGEFKKTIFFYAVELCISVVFIWRTETRSALLSLTIVICLIIIKRIIAWKQQGINKVFVKTLFIVMVIAGPITVAMGWGLENLPHILNTQVTFKKDTYKIEVEEVGGDISVEPKAVKSANIQRLSTNTHVTIDTHQANNVSTENLAVMVATQSNQIESGRNWDELMSGSLEKFTSGRTLFWKAYLREMNLLGNKNQVKIGTKRQHAHTALLAIPHRYGVFSIIPYILMLVTVLKKSWSYMYKISDGVKREYGLLPLAITIIFFSVALLDLAEYLYSSLIWILFYWVMGLFFTRRLTDEKIY